MTKFWKIVWALWKRSFRIELAISLLCFHSCYLQNLSWFFKSFLFEKFLHVFVTMAIDYSSLTYAVLKVLGYYNYYHRCGKFHWDKHLRFQPYWGFCGNTFAFALVRSTNYLRDALLFTKKICGILKNCKYSESLA